MFPGRLSYRVWASAFCILSFVLANLGLDAIIRYSQPVLMLLYPLAVTLILLTLSGRFFEYDKGVYQWVTAFTAVAAAVDFFNALPEQAASVLHVDRAAQAAARILPLSGQGFGWICPAVLGLILGLAVRAAKKRRLQHTDTV